MAYPTTYLAYTCIPSPLTLGQTQDILVIATLKTEAQLGISLTSATLTKLVIDFGDVGTGATNLTNMAFTLANIEAPSGWMVAVSGTSCTLTPTGNAGLVTNNALVVTFTNITVNTTQGNVSLTISEAAIPAPQSDNVPPTTTISSPGVESMVLPKTVAGEKKVTLSASPEAVAAGNSTTLNWSGARATDTICLLYISQGNLQTITQHANGTPLGVEDVYPDQSLNPPDPMLVLNANTNFVLQIQPAGGESTYITTSVLVSQPNLFANSLQVASNGFATVGGTTSSIKMFSNNWDSILQAVVNNSPISQDLIGVYSGWDNTGIYIAGYNGINHSSSQIKNIYFGGPYTGNAQATLSLESGNLNIPGAFSGNGIVPIGSIIPFAGHANAAPAGWLLCDGSEVSQTTYAALYQIISNLYGSGDGATTFNLPDYRGMFLRGVDDGANVDPDINFRTAQINSNGGNGTATEGTVGSRQKDTFESHDHKVKFTMEGTGKQVCGNMADSGDDRGLWIDNENEDWGGPQPTMSTGGNETRPKNVYVNYLIRAL